MLLDRGEIVDAKLCIGPRSDSYLEFDLPSALAIYESDKLNTIKNLLLDNEGSVVSSTLVQDDFYHEKTYYVFDVTSYLNEELADNYVDPSKRTACHPAIRKPEKKDLTV